MCGKIWVTEHDHEIYKLWNTRAGEGNRKRKEVSCGCAFWNENGRWLQSESVLCIVKDHFFFSLILYPIFCMTQNSQLEANVNRIQEKQTKLENLGNYLS